MSTPANFQYRPVIAKTKRRPIARVACVADAKRGGEGEREKSAKEGKREGSVCYKSRCFLYSAHHFLN